MDEEFERIERFDLETEEWLKHWYDDLGRLNVFLINQLNDSIDLIDVAGPLLNNMMILTKIKADIPMAIWAAGLEKMFDNLLRKLEQSLEVTSGYFARVFNAEAESRRMIGEIWQAAQSVKQTMLSSGLEQVYVRPIHDALQQHILARSTKAQMRKTLSELLVKEGLSTRWVETYASDTLYQFSRSYTLIMSEKTETKYWYYMGTRIKTTRSFCDKRLGKAWTQKEVESWADLTWSGKIAGTTKQSIFWYVGGYNCRHRLLPVSKVMYNSINANSSVAA